MKTWPLYFVYHTTSLDISTNLYFSWIMFFHIFCIWRNKQKSVKLYPPESRQQPWDGKCWFLQIKETILATKIVCIYMSLYVHVGDTKYIEKWNKTKQIFSWSKIFDKNVPLHPYEHPYVTDFFTCMYTKHMKFLS